MIDAYFKEERLLQEGHDEFWLAGLRNSQLSYTFYDEIGQYEMIDAVKSKGEWDGVCHIIWLDNLDGVCHISSGDKVCSDCLGAYVGEDGQLSISVFSPDDKANLFVSIFELPDGVVDAIYDQIMAKVTI